MLETKQNIDFALDEVAKALRSILDERSRLEAESLPKESDFVSVEDYDKALDDHYYEWREYPEQFVNIVERLGWSTSSLSC